MAIATATIAVASVGILAITGRIELRRVATVLLGCFILFGARTISAGLLAAVHAEPVPAPAVATAPTLTFTPPAPQPAVAPAYDPYAGAAVPPQL